ncbi:MAG: hypothetical protein AAGF83_14090 [Cyanobacteria bacterium P01_G01_bin.67]
MLLKNLRLFKIGDRFISSTKTKHDKTLCQSIKEKKLLANCKSST